VAHTQTVVPALRRHCGVFTAPAPAAWLVHESGRGHRLNFFFFSQKQKILQKKKSFFGGRGNNNWSSLGNRGTGLRKGLIGASIGKVFKILDRTCFVLGSERGRQARKLLVEIARVKGALLE